ncbi:MAG: protein kinase [Bryobacteraceae bacterium]|jgi:serine/threonine protein kinase
MQLKAGDKLGPYEIVSPIGKGGMGEVWKARDPRLNRDVAIKVAKAEFTERFKQEATLVARLNHPNICTLFDVGPNYLVMELVEGAPIRGPLPVEKAVEYAGQILDALDAAHRKSITHRDLKPANILVTKQGIKLLDFGLAKQAPGLGPDDVTVQAMTIEGQISGTLQYMAPEQLQGKKADARSDIFSFGCVLYEILSGSRAFGGTNAASVIAAILEREPEPLKTTPPLDRVIRTCLAKDPDQRFETARDLKRDLLWAMEGDTTAPSPSRLGKAGWIAAGLVTLVASVLGFVHFREKPPVVAPISSAILPPETTAFVFASQANIPALSPDGKWIVFGARTADNKNPLWIRPLASTTAQMLAGTDGATYPFWSPDSRYVAFFAGGKLKKIDISGGPALAIADGSGGAGGSWSPEGVILFSTGSTRSPLLKVAAAGGTASPATSVEATKSGAHRFPWFLPDGRHFLFEDLVVTDTVLRVGSLDSQETVVVGHADSNAVYSRGHLLFLRENTLMAQPFDEKSRTAQGEAVPVAEQVSSVSFFSQSPVGVFTVSASGLLAYQTGEPAGRQSLTWFDRSGKALSKLGESGVFVNLEFSPDGKNAAVSVRDAAARGNGDIWIYDTVRGLRTRFTFDPANDRRPVWSPDGNTIVWDRLGAKGQLYRRAADGKGAEELLYEDTGVLDPTSWSPDGKFLLFNTDASGTRGGVWILPLLAEKPGSRLKPSPLVDPPFGKRSAAFSPDGHWVAYESNESSRREVYVIPFPGPGGKRQISTAGGGVPRWRRDGKEIFYAGLDGKLMAAEVTLKTGSIEVGQARPLGVPVSFFGGPIQYDVSPDGQRFLVVAEPERTASPPLTLVQNWTAALKK